MSVMKKGDYDDTRSLVALISCISFPEIWPTRFFCDRTGAGKIGHSRKLIDDDGKFHIDYCMMVSR